MGICSDCGGFRTVPRDDMRHPGNDVQCPKCHGTGEFTEWWEIPVNLADLVRWMYETDALPTDRWDVIVCVTDILDKPWKWNAEYQEMRQEEENVRKLEQSVLLARAGRPGGR